MRHHPPTILLLISLYLQVHTFLTKGGEAFPKPTKKPPVKVHMKNVTDVKTEDIKNFRPDPPKVERLSEDKILSECWEGEIVIRAVLFQ